MACAGCGRTAKREWLVFHFDRKKKEFLCSQCHQKRDDRNQKVSFPPQYTLPGLNAISTLGMMLLLVIIILPVFIWLWHSIDEIYEELNEPEPITIENITAKREVKIYGRMEGVDGNGRIIYRDRDERNRSVIVKNDFILHQGNISIHVTMSKGTTIRQFEDEHIEDPPLFMSGDLVYVVGTAELDENGDQFLIADEVLDQEIDTFEAVQEARSALLVVIIFFLMVPAAMFVQIFLTLGAYLHEYEERLRIEEGKSKGQAGPILTEDGQSLTKAESSVRRYGISASIPRRSMIRAGFMISLIAAIVVSVVYIWTVSHLSGGELEFTYIIIFSIPAFFILFLPIGLLDTMVKVVSTVGVGRDGILIHRETTEPFHHSWRSVKSLGRVGKKLKITKKDGGQWDYRMPRRMAAMIMEYWEKVDIFLDQGVKPDSDCMYCAVCNRILNPHSEECPECGMEEKGLINYSG